MDIAALGLKVELSGADSAFGALSKLSEQALKTERSLSGLESAAGKSSRSQSEAAKSSNQLSSSARSVASASKDGATGVNNFSEANRSLATTASLATASLQAFLGLQVVSWAKGATVSIYQASSAAERLRIGLDFSSVRGSANEINYLRETTDKLGLSFSGTAGAYQQFQASARGTALEGDKARAVFEAVSKASAVMGLSADQSSGALLALQQMVSKGTVQAEELRGQLGERLPGAFQTAARAMGVTTAELGKMLEQGEVIAEDFLPKFARELEKSLGDAPEKAADRLDASLNRVNNAWERLKQNVGESGVSSFMSGQMNILSDAVGNFNNKIEAARASGAGFGGQLLAAAGAAAEFINPINAVSYSALEAGNKLKEAEARLQELKDSGAKASSNLMLREAYKHAERLVNKLREAKKAQDDLSGGGLGGAYTEGMGTSSVITRQREAEANSEKDLADIRMRAAGINKQYYADLKTLQEGLSIGTLTNEQYVKSVSELAKRTWDASTAGKEAAKTQRDAAKGVGAAENAYTSLSKRVKDYIEQLRIEATQSDKVSTAQKLQIQLDDLLVNSKGKVTAAKVASLKADIQTARAMEEEAKAVKRTVEAYQDYIRDQEAIAKADVELSKAKEALWKSIADQNIELENQSRMLELEASNIGKTAYERTLANEVLKTQIELEKELRDISNNQTLDGGAKTEAEAAARARAVKKIALAERKAYVTEWEKTSKMVGDTLSDYIMGGGKDAAQYLKRLFSNLVLQPVVQTAVSGILGGGAGQGAASGLGGLSNLGNMASNVSTLMGLSGSGAALGSLGLSNAIGMAGGDALGSLIATNATNWGVAGGAAAGGSFLGAVGAAMPWLAGGLAIASLFGGDLFKKSTPHMGASAIYQGGEVSRGWMPEGQFQEEMFTAIGGIAQSIGSALDATAESFGKKAGYTLSTVFSDDTSKDKAFGGLSIISPDGQKIADWSGFDQKWGGKRFSDGEAGYKEYLAALTEDVKTAFMAMDLPGWSDQLIEAATDLDSLNQALQGVSSIKASFDALGRSMEMFSGISGELQTVLLETTGSMDTLLAGANAFYQGFYSEAERMEALQKQLRDTLTGLDLSIDPAMGDEAKDQFRAAVEAAMSAGQGEVAAQLLAMSQSFATAADYAQNAAEQMSEAINQIMIDLMAERRTLSAEYLRASGDADGYAEALRSIATEGYNDAERAAWDYNEALRAQISALDEAAQLQQSLADITGTSVKTVQGVLQDLLGRVAAISSFRTSLGQSIESARLGTMDLSGQASYLRGKEKGLWNQLDTSEDPLEVAQKLQQTILDRINVEAKMREQVEQATLGSLQKQLSTVEAMKSAAQSMQNTVDNLRLGSTSALSPYAQLQYAGTKFDEAYARALSGDMEAWKDVQSFGQSYVGLGRDVFASSTDSADIFFKVTEAMDQLAAMGMDLDPQITALNTQIELLQSVGDNTTQQAWISEQQLHSFEKLNAVMQRQQENAQQQADKQLELAKEQIAELKKINELLIDQLNQSDENNAGQARRDASLINATADLAESTRLLAAQPA